MVANLTLSVSSVLVRYILAKREGGAVSFQFVPFRRTDSPQCCHPDRSRAAFARRSGGTCIPQIFMPYPSRDRAERSHSSRDGKTLHSTVRWLPALIGPIELGNVPSVPVFPRISPLVVHSSLTPQQRVQPRRA